MRIFNKKGIQNPIKFVVVLGCIFISSATGCTKFVQVSPPAADITSATVYSDDLSAAAAETGIYDLMMQNASGLTSGPESISLFGGMSADEFTNYKKSAIYAECYTNSMSSTNAYFWPELFQLIYVANSVLEGVAGSTGVTTAEKQQLTGEAKFIRAFLHFYGTNLFGAFPIVTTTNYQVNNTISRSSPAEVYQQVIADLTDAQNLLPDNFVTPTGQITTTQRIRPNRWTAIALLARAYLYQASWDSAAMEATLVINNSSLFNLDTLNGVFLANSNEAIWQLEPVLAGYNTTDAKYFVLTSPPGSADPVALDSGLINTFEAGDQRLVNWVGEYNSATQIYYYPYKYKVYILNEPVTEYQMVLRLAEQYLIRAEARAEEGNLSGAAADLNTIRVRAGLDSTTAVTQQDLLAAIYHERRVELFSEWGHRWFDLQRTGAIDTVMGSPGNACQNKGGSWNPDWAVFPVPQSDINLNSNLKQNPGYN